MMSMLPWLDLLMSHGPAAPAYMLEMQDPS